jgi:TonB family protein
MNCLNCGKPLGAGLKFCPACGSAVPQPAPFAPPHGEARPSFGASHAAAPPRRKSRAGKILLVVFGVFLVLAAGAGLAVYYGIRYFADTVKSSEPYRVAEQELRDNVVANGVLGGIAHIGFPVGAYGTDPDGSGQAAFTMSVEGSLAKGQYVVALQREGGTWRVVKSDLRMSDGTVHNLLDSPETGAPSADLELEDGPPPPPAPPGDAGVVTVKVPGAVEVGPLDEAAQSKPEPAYPSVARAARATGKVVVRVTVDESGRVILASAMSGHPLLRAAAEAAARQARFAPTVRNGRPVKAMGTLAYEFR